MKSLAPLLLLLLAGTPGCVLLLGAAVGATAYHVASEDTVEFTYGRSLEETFRACEAELASAGTVEMADLRRQRLQGEVDDARVEIEILQTGDRLGTVRIRARRISGVSPALEVAEDVATGIARRLN